MEKLYNDPYTVSRESSVTTGCKLVAHVKDFEDRHEKFLYKDLERHKTLCVAFKFLNVGEVTCIAYGASIQEHRLSPNKTLLRKTARGRLLRAPRYVLLNGDNSELFQKANGTANKSTARLSILSKAVEGFGLRGERFSPVKILAFREAIHSACQGCCVR